MHEFQLDNYDKIRQVYLSLIILVDMRIFGQGLSLRNMPRYKTSQAIYCTKLY